MKRRGTNSLWVPHVRTSVRGISKTGRSPFKALTTFPQSKIRVPHISLVFGECAYPTVSVKAEDGHRQIRGSGPQAGLRFVIQAVRIASGSRSEG
jgi:hypothetical protein